MISRNKLAVYSFAFATIFYGFLSASNAEGAWTSNEKKIIGKLEKRIEELEIIVAQNTSTKSDKMVLTIPYLVESKNQYGDKGECGSGSFRSIDSRGTAALMTAGTYRLHTCVISFSVEK